MGKKGDMTGGAKPGVKKKVKPLGKRDSDKDEVERDDLMPEDIVELGTINGKWYWASVSQSFTGNIVNDKVYPVPEDSGDKIYKFRNGMNKPVPKMVTRSERAVYAKVVVGTYNRGNAHFLNKDENDGGK